MEKELRDEIPNLSQEEIREHINKDFSSFSQEEREILIEAYKLAMGA